MSFIHDLYKGAPTGEHRKTPFYMGDKSAYLSPIDRKVVDGRTAHKEHMVKHGVQEAGDMKPSDYGTKAESVGGIRSDIQRAIQESNR